MQVPVTSWFDDMADTELLELLPFFESIAAVDSIYTVLRNANSPVNHNHNMVYASQTSCTGTVGGGGSSGDDSDVDDNIDVMHNQT